MDFIDVDAGIGRYMPETVLMDIANALDVSTDFMGRILKIGGSLSMDVGL